MTIWFNDDGESKIQPGKLKIDRVRSLSEKIFRPDNVEVEFYSEDYKKLLESALLELDASVGGKGLFFIDPYGYKDIRPNDLKKILTNNNAEVLLFLPISFMYRFMNKALNEGFPGSEPLERFITELYQDTPIPGYDSPFGLIDELKDQFSDYLQEFEIFVDTFVIEAESKSVFCLFFFTHSLRGLHKMLEAKWSLDENRGQGYRPNKGRMLFDDAVLRGYPDKLQKFLLEGSTKSNKDVFVYSLKEGFLPKHTVTHLKDWQNNGQLVVHTSDNQRVRKGAFYLERQDKQVYFEFDPGSPTTFQPRLIS